MEKYDIRIYKAAKQDMLYIVDYYINMLSPQATIEQYERIVERIGSLAEMPERCHLLNNDNLRLKGYRVLRADNYMIFFIVKGKVVQIRRILYGKRNYEWLL